MSSDTDYSRRGVVEKQHAIKSVPKRLASKLWIMIFRIFIIAIVLVGVVGVMGVFGAFKGMIDSSPEVHWTF